MTAPANDQVHVRGQRQETCITNNMEHGVGDTVGLREVKATAVEHFIARKYDVAEHG